MTTFGETTRIITPIELETCCTSFLLHLCSRTQSILMWKQTRDSLTWAGRRHAADWNDWDWCRSICGGWWMERVKGQDTSDQIIQYPSSLVSLSPGPRQRGASSFRPVSPVSPFTLIIWSTVTWPVSKRIVIQRRSRKPWNRIDVMNVHLIMINAEVFLWYDHMIWYDMICCWYDVIAEEMAETGLSEPGVMWWSRSCYAREPSRYGRTLTHEQSRSLVKEYHITYSPLTWAVSCLTNTLKIYIKIYIKI